MGVRIQELTDGSAPASSDVIERARLASPAAIAAATTISFTAATNTISDSGGGLLTAGFAEDQSIAVTGAGDGDNNVYSRRIVSVDANDMVIDGAALADEAAGASVSIWIWESVRLGPAAIKRQGITSASTITPNADDDIVDVTALAAAATIAAPAGTPQDGWGLVIRITDNGTARALTWDGAYRAIGVTLPTTTVLGKQHYVAAIYNSAAGKWDVVAVGVRA